MYLYVYRYIIHTFIRIHTHICAKFYICACLHIYIYCIYMHIFMNLIVHPRSGAAVCVIVYCVVLFRGQPNQRYVFNFDIGTKDTGYWPSPQPFLDMAWLRLAGSLKLQVSFAKEPYKRDNILQKRPIILRSLLIVATPHYFMGTCDSVTSHMYRSPLQNIVSFVGLFRKRDL